VLGASDGRTPLVGAAPLLGLDGADEPRRARWSAQDAAQRGGRLAAKEGAKGWERKGSGAEHVEEEVAVDWWIRSWMWREREGGE